MLQIESIHEVASATTTDARVRVERVDETTRPEVAEVTVTLSWSGTEHTGRAAGGPERHAREFLVAEATLQALAAVTGAPNHFALRDVSTTRAGDVDVLVAVVSETNGPDRPLVGTAVLDRDNVQVGAAKAVLDAVNRRLATRL